MGIYRVARNYRAVYRSQPISFDADATVEVDDETAAWVNNDSPGCLIATDEPAVDAGEALVGIDAEVGETVELVDEGPENGPVVEVVNLDALDRDGLLAYADEHGIDVNRRLGEDKLRQAIAEAPVPPVISAEGDES